MKVRIEHSTSKIEIWAIKIEIFKRDMWALRETQGKVKPNFLADIPGFWAGYPGGAHKFKLHVKPEPEFCTKDFFSSHEFSYENAPKFPRNFCKPCSVGQKKFAENSLQISLNFPNFPVKDQKKFATSFSRQRIAEKTKFE